MSIEYRSFTGAESVDTTDDGTIFGLAIPYSRETTIGDMGHGGFREQIAPGSCTKSIREADIVALFNHNSGQPLGRTSAGNLTLTNTTRGVEPELKPVDTTYGNDVLKLVKSGVIRGWSFGFIVVKDDWTDDDGKESDEWTGTNRTIREMKLIEVSPVTFPAYDSTDISARSGLLAEREAHRNAGKPETASKRSEGKSASAAVEPATGVVAAPDDEGRAAAADTSKPYGKVTYADPGYQSDGKSRYPLDTSAHVKAAWAFINVAANAKAYNSQQLASIKTKIKAAAKTFGVSISDDEAKSAEQADEWRAEAEAEESRVAGKRTTCTECGGTLTCNKCDDASDDDKKSADPDTEDRDAKATYADIETCGECGATSQYGAFCGACGEPMAKSKPQGGFCTSCGAELDGKRDAHVCETRKDKPATSTLTPSTSERIPQIVAVLSEALGLFKGADIDSLPADVQKAIALVASASVHASHIQGHEGLAPSDSIGSDDDGRSVKPKPDLSTSTETTLTDDALKLAYAQAISREVSLGI